MSNARNLANLLNSSGVLTADAGLKADNITIDGTEIDLSSGDLTVDSAGDIILSSGGGEVRFDDGSQQEFVVDMNDASTKTVLRTLISDSDLVFEGNDGGVGFEAMRIDMSDAGTAIFNHDITLDGKITGASQVTQDVNTSSLSVAGGTDSNVGANMTVFGGSHSSLAGVVRFRNGSTELLRITSTGDVGIGDASPESNTNFTALTVTSTASTGGGQVYVQSSSVSSVFGADNTSDPKSILRTVTNHPLTFGTNNTENARFNTDGKFLLGTTSDAGATQNTDLCCVFSPSGRLFTTADGHHDFNRQSDGEIIRFRSATGVEGQISVSGSTVSYGGFSGLHESSGIATDTPIGTVVSTIDELDVYPEKQDGEDHPKAGKIRADHAKVKVSDTTGDSSVYGVVNNFTSEGKVNIASVGIGSVRVTGACIKGDLLESNGDGTAKVQSDDILRSKTIGKVTIGNSSTDEKLVSCVLYCG